MIHSRVAPWVLCLAAGLIVGCDDDSSPSSIASPDLQIPTGGSDPAPDLDPTEDFVENDFDDDRDGTVDDGDDGSSDDQRDAPVPEPGTMVLLGGGAAALAAMRRRKAAARD